MLNFKDEVKKIGFEINDDQLEKFEYYYKKLVEVNEYMNLTAITEHDEVYIKHFIDSIYLLRAIDKKEPYNICDVGSGAGFPGLPLAIMDSNANVSIVDSLNKRINFLNFLFNEMGMTNITAIHNRAEEYAKEKRESFDYVTARAVARLNILIELCMPLVKVNGYFISMKGILEDELEEARNGISKLGGRIEGVIEYKLPYDMGNRTIVVIKKIKETPVSYPRSFADIKRKPL